MGRKRKNKCPEEEIEGTPIEKPLNGEERVFEELFETSYQQLCKYACHYLKDIDEAEEVVQGVFYQLWEKRTSIEITAYSKAYLYVAVRNNCLNKIKHMKIRKEHRESVIRNSETSSNNTTQKIISKELEEMIGTAIDSLPEQCGLIFKLSRYEKLKYAEIATHLEISVKTVENQMGKALRIMREKLKDYMPVLLCILMIRF